MLKFENNTDVFNVQEFKFISCKRLIKLQDLQLKNISNLMYESIIDKNDIFNIIQEMLIVNKVILQKLERNKKNV